MRRERDGMPPIKMAKVKMRCSRNWSRCLELDMTSNGWLGEVPI